MLSKLLEAEGALRGLLRREDEWRSLHVDYHAPVVERLWIPWGEHRIHLHRIHPCEPGEALFHPHPWPSAVRLLVGSYEMAIGYGDGPQAPPVAALMVIAPGTRYEMTEPRAWHHVRPIGSPSLSLMVTGRPWNPDAPPARPQLAALDPALRSELFALFRAMWPD